MKEYTVSFELRGTSISTFILQSPAFKIMPTPRGKKSY